MSEFARFMKGNKAKKENVFFAATRSLRDEKGAPLLWELRHLSAREVDDIRESCTFEEPVPGKPNLLRPRLRQTQYMRRLMAASIVVPDLHDAALQDSYEVKTPEDLLLALVDDPGEYTELATFIQRLQGFDVTLEEKAQQAKN